MTATAVVLILIAATIHATWNYMAKRAGGGAAFVWLFGVVSVLVYTPLAMGLLWYYRRGLGPLDVTFMFGSAAIHAGYFLLLQRGYRTGDLSLVYPVARGTGPLLSTVAAIVLLGESPALLALAGGMLVVGGIFIQAFGGRGWHHGTALAYGVLTGVLIASYTLWDKYAVATLLIPPIVLDWGSNLGRTLLVSPYALTHRRQVREVWALHRFEVIAVGLMAPMSYILVLSAMVFTPVSYVAPAREVSIVIGTLFGSHLLAEPDATRRLLGAVTIVAGVIALAVA